MQSMRRADLYLLRAVLSFFVLAAAATVSAQPADSAPAPATSSAPSIVDEADHAVAPPTLLVPHAAGGPSRAPGASFWPDLAGPALPWFAAVVILLLVLQLRPLICIRNVDAIALAATCLLLLGRTHEEPAFGSPFAWQTISAALLTAAAAYWLLRALSTLGARRIARFDVNVSSGAMLVLTLAGIAVCVTRISTAPISPASRDGVVGGICVAATGKLPYGETPGYDTRSPLLYFIHAGAAQAAAPLNSFADDPSHAPLQWKDRATWLSDPEWWLAEELPAARLVNALLFVMVLVATYAIGARLHSAAIGLTMAAALCVFPGTVECVSRPEIMLPTALLSWAMLLALLPGGGLLAGLFCVLAGVAWPWAWLTLPIFLAFAARRGWDGFGGLAGTLGGAALAVFVLLQTTIPTLPRADGALATAGTPPQTTIRVGGADRLIAEPRIDAPAPAPAVTAPLWRALLSVETLDLPTSRLDATSSAPANPPRFRDLAPTPEARPIVQSAYREAAAGASTVARSIMAIRTTLESTWLSRGRPDWPMAPAWETWAGEPLRAGTPWHTARRAAKATIGALALALGFLILRQPVVRPHHLVGGLLAMCSLILVGSAMGAVANLVFVLPGALALLALHHHEPPPTRSAGRTVPIRATSRVEPIPGLKPPAAPPAIEQAERPALGNPEGPAPRISIDR